MLIIPGLRPRPSRKRDYTVYHCKALRMSTHNICVLEKLEKKTEIFGRKNPYLDLILSLKQGNIHCILTVSV